MDAPLAHRSDGHGGLPVLEGGGWAVAFILDVELISSRSWEKRCESQEAFHPLDKDPGGGIVRAAGYPDSATYWMDDSAGRAGSPA